MIIIIIIIIIFFLLISARSHIGKRASPVGRDLSWI